MESVELLGVAAEFAESAGVAFAGEDGVDVFGVAEAERAWRSRAWAGGREHALAGLQRGDGLVDVESESAGRP